jgi:hypothetical protein
MLAFVNDHRPWGINESAFTRFLAKYHSGAATPSRRKFCFKIN